MSKITGTHGMDLPYFTALTKTPQICNTKTSKKLEIFKKNTATVEGEKNTL